MTLNFQDFQKQDVKFDIDELQKRIRKYYQSKDLPVLMEFQILGQFH